jgi:pSer/pThr/pTyr-binding forkhead associated (FHA) protein
METSHLLGLMDKIEGVTYLGRSAENDVVANQSSVSRVHALVAKDVLGFLYISDLKSQNGTYVNGKRIDSNYRLQADDEVILGSLDGAHSVFKVVKNTVLNEHNIAVNTYELEAVSGVETKEDQLAREQQKLKKQNENNY